VLPPAFLVDDPGDELLSHADVPMDQDSRIRWSHLLYTLRTNALLEPARSSGIRRIAVAAMVFDFLSPYSHYGGSNKRKHPQIERILPTRIVLPIGRCYGPADEVKLPVYFQLLQLSGA